MNNMNTTLKMNRIAVFALTISVLFFTNAVGQNKVISLSQIIEMAQFQSLEAEKAKNRKENSYWAFESVKSNIKPSLNLRGTLPDYSKTISSTPQNDGSYEFRETHNMRSDVRLTLDQNVLWTGGQFSLYSSLNRIDDFNKEMNATSYSSNPLGISFIQPLFSFNSWKWEKKIEPLKFEESEKRFKEDNVNISFRCTGMFFDLLLAQINLNIAQINMENSELNHQIAKGRYNLGKIAENELLELELNLLNAERDKANAQLDVETSRLKLNTFVGIVEKEEYQLLIPETVPDFLIDAKTALAEAKKNRRQYVSFKRRTLEAEREVSRAKSQNTLDITIVGDVGLTDQAAKIGDVYYDSQNSQRYRVGVNIPLVDWNRRKSSLKTALANQQLEQNSIKQQEQLFDEEIYTLVKKIPILRDRVISTKRGDEIAEKRYHISQERYLVANISVTDLNLALNAKDQAKSAYLRSLREYWTAYYQLRMLTLYDFVTNTPL
ncbi:MAG: TolC family protein [Reichenbachiella sp.]